MPPGATLVFSRARRVARRCSDEARAARLRRVRRHLPAGDQGAHRSRQARASEGYEFIMIGHKGHPEVEGTMGQLRRRHPPGRGRGRRRAACSPRRPSKLAFVTQTTLSVDDAAEIIAARASARFPSIREPKQQDICYATQNRQDAVKMHGAAVRRGDRGRQPDQLQHQPPARTGASKLGVPTLHGRQRRRAAARVARRQGARRPDRRRLGARGAGAAR